MAYFQILRLEIFFAKIQNLIVNVAKMAALATFKEFLDHFLSKIDKNLRSPKDINLTRN
jgi:hypothetical protein